jgi:hypothetical protein
MFVKLGLFIPREEHRLKVFENKVLEVFGSKRNDRRLEKIS